MSIVLYPPSRWPPFGARSLGAGIVVCVFVFWYIMLRYIMLYDIILCYIIPYYDIGTVCCVS